ncbi:MAG: hypothetical protein JXR96_27115 [Deltaproteobacteria bacterium]|nr:hypothetical protein [Deltaproteobacteria bacterium]
MRACLSVLLAAALSACSFVSYNRVLSDRPIAAEAIVQSDSISVRPVSFENLDKPESYITKDQFLEEMRAEIPEFAEELNFQSIRTGLSGRVRMVGADEVVPSGVIVESHAVLVRLGWDFYKGGVDTLDVDLAFKDAQSGAILFESRVQLASHWHSEQPHKMNTSVGRLGIATWNLVRPILSVIEYGRVTPRSW